MAEMFPTIPDTIPAQASGDIGRVPAFDSGESLFLMRDGALIERSGLEAVRQWIDLMLRQQIDRVPIYQTGADTKIGIDRSLLGSRLPTGLMAAEVERNVRETMGYCPAIRAVRDFKITRRGRACHVEFTAVLNSGDTVEVTKDV
ncbi:DUF2634 domain-containing protein [uncultured Oscillibacter sp.]|uniref:DUF2634 domain-containing protein n=1 Tax=uncultured Oscillibacter sp. TaxID=876091 RepID=UPI0025E96A23|nr:DUF2634 domain-containing protein [uncultured Oscillibacter sp.]